MKTPTFRLKALSLGLIASIAVVLMCMFCPARAMAEEDVATNDIETSDISQDVVAYSIEWGPSGACPHLYWTVEAAINAGYSGRTIYLSADWNLDNTLGICDSKRITIDMNGHKITNKCGATIIRLYENSQLTLTSSKKADFFYEGYDSQTGDPREAAITTGGLVTGARTTEAGGIWMEDCTRLIMDGVAVAGNKGYDGGGIKIGEECNLYMQNGASIQNNRASNYGGGIYVYDDDSHIRLDNSIIAYNFATRAGGGIGSDVDGTRVNLENDSKINNNTSNYGGGVAFMSSYQSVASDDKTGIISANNASLYGGGVYFSRDKIGIYGCAVTENHAGYSGGGVGTPVNLFCSGNELTLENCSITNNHCGNASCYGEGGGVMLDMQYDVRLSGKVIINGNYSGVPSNTNNLFLDTDGASRTAYIYGGVEPGSSVGVRTEVVGEDCLIGQNITTYTPGTFFMDLGGYYVTKGTDHGGDLWQRHGNNRKFTVQLHGKTVGEYYPGETVTVDGSTGNDYIVFNKWLEDVSSGLWPFADFVEDETNPKLTFTMPENDVSLMCGYRAVDPTPAPRPSA